MTGEEAVVATQPSTDNVLVTEDLTAPRAAVRRLRGVEGPGQPEAGEQAGLGEPGHV